jgi:acetoin utilization protein AcuB
MLMPTISRCMTRQPWTIASDAPLVQARALMRERHIRHLPVVEGGKLAGIVSERDIHRTQKLLGGDPDVRVRDAMTIDVFVVGIEDPLDQVVERMSNRKYGSAVVLGRDGQIQGILTTVDALQFLADLLQRETDAPMLPRTRGMQRSLC